MSSEPPKQLVLVVGATGNTGKSIIDGLLKSGAFRVAALVRAASLAKPTTATLRAAGVEVRTGDLTADDATLAAALAGVDVLVSAVSAWALADQRAIIRVAHALGTVERVVPCDFGTPGARGVRPLHDAKLDIRDYVRALDVLLFCWIGQRAGGDAREGALFVLGRQGSGAGCDGSQRTNA